MDHRPVSSRPSCAVLAQRRFREPAPLARRRAILRAVALCALPALAAPGAPALAATQRVFVTSATCNGDLGACSVEVGDAGVAAGNHLCQAAATAAGLTAGGEQFRAWLSDATVDAYCNALGLGGKLSDLPPCGVATLPAAGPWMRRDGVPFAHSLADLVGGDPLAPIGVDESATPVAGAPFFTGTLNSGAVATGFTCGNWTDGTIGSLAYGGRTDSTASDFLFGASNFCDGPQRIVCLEVGAGDPLTFPSAPGAIAFVSSETGSGNLALWASSGGGLGTAGADAVCRALAGQARLPFPLEFVAWLSDGTTGAAARLTIDGPWERVDGIPIAASLADLTDGALGIPVGRTESGVNSSDNPWTGTSALGVATGDDCLDWGSADGGDSGTRGRAWRGTDNWTDAGPTSCNASLPIYCFSNRLLLGWDGFESGDLFRWSASVGAN